MSTLSYAMADSATMLRRNLWFADHQPFTPLIETLRGLLLGTGIGNDGIVTIAWFAAIGLLSYLWAKALYNRDPSR